VFAKIPGFRKAVTMREQGCSTLVAEKVGPSLDRLAGLEKIIPPALIKQALLDTGRCNPRACVLNHEVMLWVVMAMGLFTNMPIRQVFKHARRFAGGKDTPCRSSLCEGRKRLGPEPVQRLFDLVVRPLATAETPGAFYRGRRLVSLDGSVFDAPDSDANRQAFQRASGSRGQGAFPQVRKLSLVEVGTHVELALAVGGWQDSEASLAQQLLPKIPQDALVLVDRGLFSYSLWKPLQERGLALLARVSEHLKLRPIKTLPDGSYLAKIYPCSYARTQDQDGLVVRVLEYTHNDSRRVGCGQRHRLITTLLDDEAHAALELICGYHERWEIELTFDEQKTHQDPRRASKPAHFRSETPQGVQQEVYALSLGHFITRALMLQAARPQRLDTDRLSFTGCLHILRCRLPECDGSSPATMQSWYEALLWEMQQELIEPRRNRVNPRVIKRKMSKWPKKQPEHRRLPPLQKTFRESVIMPI
jgi:Insertion element 4 transposase N-terminal/Transposase DDE domain